MDDVSGVRQTTCPWRALHDGFTRAVLDAHKWWTKGALDRSSIPEALRRGLHAYDSALNAVLTHDARRERERAEQTPDEARPGPSSPIRTRLQRAPRDAPRRRRR